MHACVLAHVKARGWWVSSSVILHFIFLREDISLNMELAIWTRLAGQQTLGIQLSPSHQSSIAGPSPHTLIFMTITRLQWQAFIRL